MEKKIKQLAIGIDLGTTYSCVGVWQRGRVEIIADDNGKIFTPTRVEFAEKEFFAGGTDIEQLVCTPDNTVFDLKRLIGRRWDDSTLKKDIAQWQFMVVQDSSSLSVEVDWKNLRKRFSPQELASMVLKRMKKSAEAYLGTEVKDAVVTVPAYFNDAQRQATKEAGTIAGLNILRIINDPTAAAIAYGLNGNHKGCENVLIFDLGGGTCDVSILRITDGISFEVQAIAGNTHLGGQDFDSRLLNYLQKNFERKYKLDLSHNPRALHRLRVAAMQAKHTLSSNTEAIVEINSLSNDLDFRIRVSRAKFVDLCSDLFTTAICLIDKAMADAGMDKGAIDEIVLVGGSTRIPKIRSLLQNYFNGKKLNCSINPDEAVVRGASLQAAMLTGNASSDFAIQEFLIIDVTPLSLGIETLGGLMTTLIHRNTVIPCRMLRFFTTSADYQSGILIKVYEGERTMAEDNSLLGIFKLSGIPLAARGVARIEVSFDLDADGILCVTANDCRSGSRNKVKITRDESRCNCQVIQGMLKSAKLHESEDTAKFEKLSCQRALENYVLFIKQTVRDKDDDLCREDRDVLNSLSEEILRWLVGNNYRDKNVYVERLDMLRRQSSPIIARIQESTTHRRKKMRH